MKVLIIEDEKPASQKLIRLLKETGSNIEVIDILRSVEQSTNWLLNNSKPDLIFMDIQLEDGVCFEIFENISVQTPIIFTTVYDKYTLQAFKVNSIDYLLKPIDSDELKNAIEKFKNHYARIQPTEIESILSQLQPKTKERFLIKIGEHYQSVQTSMINCFYIKERCNFILTDKGKNYPIDFSLDKLEQLIDSELFFRINRNFILNYSAIKDIVAYSSNRLKIVLNNWNDKEEIIVSRERVSDFKAWMDK